MFENNFIWTKIWTDISLKMQTRGRTPTSYLPMSSLENPAFVLSSPSYDILLCSMPNTLGTYALGVMKTVQFS